VVLGRAGISLAQRSVVPDPVDPPEFALQRTGGGTGLLADQPADRSR